MEIEKILPLVLILVFRPTPRLFAVVALLGSVTRDAPIEKLESVSIPIIS